MDLRDYLRLLRSRWLLIAVITLMGLGAAAAATLATTPQYKSTTTVFVSAGDAQASLGSAYTGSLLSQQRVQSYVDVAKGRPIAQGIVDQLHLTISPDAVVGMMSVDNPLDTVLLNLSISNADPALSQQVAAAWVDQLTQAVNRIEQSGTGGSSLFKISVIEPAGLPHSPTSPRPTINLALGLLVGLAIGVGTAVLLETLDTRVREVAALPGIAGAPLLGALATDSEIPKHPLIIRDRPHSPQAEAFRGLRTNLQFIDVDQRPRSIVVTSAVPREGKSTVAMNLAIALAEAGTPVALVDADLRRPSLADRLGLSGDAGLTDVLIGRASIGDVIQRSGSTGRLWVLTSGSLPPNPSELLGSKQMRTALDELARVSTVIIDAPPLLPVTDAAVLAAQTDGAILVIALGRTRRDQVRAAATRLESVGGRLLGVVANRASTRGSEGYAYAYGYGYAAKGRHRDTEPDGTALQPFSPFVEADAEPADRTTSRGTDALNGDAKGHVHGSANGTANGHANSGGFAAGNGHVNGYGPAASPIDLTD